MDMGRLLSPGDAAELLGITSDTLRRWERNGLIESERTPGGQRRYREGDIRAMLTGEPTTLPRHDLTRAAAVGHIADDRTQGQSAHSPTQMPPWEQRVSEERAQLEIAKLRRERAGLVRADQIEKEERERNLIEATQVFAQREVEAKKIAATEAKDRIRLDGLRVYGLTSASFAPPEYQAKIVRDLARTVNAKDYPPEMTDYLAKAAVSARVDYLLKPWREAQARERAKAESRRTRQDLITSGRWHAYGATLNWEPHDADRARREVDQALHAEVESDWTQEHVYDLVDDVLDEWVEE